MEHQEVRELLADAAVEPGGLERLMAGDTPNAALVASHLAGCPSCTEELERLRRTVGVIRPAMRAVPPPELRQRTLDYVAAVGRPRGMTAAAATAAGASAAPITGEAGGAAPAPPIPLRPDLRRARLGTLAAMAAALILGVVGAGVLVSGSRDSEVRSQAEAIDALTDVARWTLKVEAQPDARRVDLASTNGSSTTGTLLFSPTANEVVVVADDLAPAPAGHEYRCWVEVGGVRQPVGKMFFGGDLAYWVGDVAKVKDLPAGATFGVTLVDTAAPQTPGKDVLRGAG